MNTPSPSSLARFQRVVGCEEMRRALDELPGVNRLCLVLVPSGERFAARQVLIGHNMPWPYWEIAGTDGVRLLKSGRDDLWCYWPEAASAATCDVVAERSRQITAEGWTPEHDDQHTAGQIGGAAAVYALCGSGWDEETAADRYWPWHPSWLKTGDRRRCLVKAAALIIAEIERLDRAQERASNPPVTSGPEKTHE